MNTHSRDQWIALHAQYLADPQASHHGLIMDASIFLDSAHGIVQTMSDAMGGDDIINNDRLCSALNGVALLVEMGRRCIALADARMITAGPPRSK